MVEYDELAGRPHGGRPTVPIVLSAEACAAIAAAMRPAKAYPRVVRRAQALLMMADGVPGTGIARVLGVRIEVSDRTVGRFLKDADLQPHRQSRQPSADRCS